MSETQTSVFGRTYSLVATTLFFVTGACALMVRGFLASFTAIPADGIKLERFEKLLTHELAAFLVAAVEIAAPVLVTLFLAELVLGVLSKAAPSLNVFALGFPLRVIVALSSVAMALPLLIPSVGHIADQIGSNMGL